MTNFSNAPISPTALSSHGPLVWIDALHGFFWRRHLPDCAYLTNYPIRQNTDFIYCDCGLYDRHKKAAS